MRKWAFKFDRVYDVEGETKFVCVGTGVRYNPLYPLKEGQVGVVRDGYYALVGGLVRPIDPRGISLKEGKKMIISAKRTVDGVVTDVPVEPYADTKGASKVVFDLCFDRKLYVPKTIVVDEMQAQVLARNIQFEVTVDGQTLTSQLFDEVRRFVKGFVPGKRRVVQDDTIDSVPSKYKTSPEEEKEYCRKYAGDGSTATAFEEHCAKIDRLRAEIA
jgi:hypothetical protein